MTTSRHQFGEIAPHSIHFGQSGLAVSDSTRSQAPPQKHCEPRHTFSRFSTESSGTSEPPSQSSERAGPLRFTAKGRKSSARKPLSRTLGEWERSHSSLPFRPMATRPSHKYAKDCVSSMPRGGSFSPPISKTDESYDLGQLTPSDSPDMFLSRPPTR